MESIKIECAQGVVVELHVSKLGICYGGELLVVKKTPFRLLVLLVKKKGSVVSREAIYKEVWGYDFDPGTKIIDVQICYLRRVFNSLALPFEIKTHRFLGFSFQCGCPVSRVPASEAAKRKLS